MKLAGSSWAAVLVLALLTTPTSALSQTPEGIAVDPAEHARAVRPNDVDSLDFYLLANTQFALFHELGHALIHTLDLPVLGREEDAADTLAIAGLLIGDKEQLQKHLLERLIVVSDEWLLEWNENESQSAYWDSHGLEIQRFYDIVCLIYGSDTQRFADIAFGSALPAERSFGCEGEFETARHAVEWVLARHGTPERLRGARERRANGKVTVSYEAPTTANGAWLAAVLAKDG